MGTSAGKSGWAPGAISLLVIAACSCREPEATDVIRVAIAEEVGNLTPYGAAVPETLLGLVYDKLAAPAPYMADARPHLAAVITPRGADNRIWHIELREGVRWHDGMPFVAADVAFTLTYYRDGPANRWTHHVSETPTLDRVTVIDPLRLEIRCADPCPHFDKVTAADLPILPAHLWRNVREPHRYAGPLIGTGPYRVVAFSAGRYVRLEANPSYFAGKPRVRALLVSFVRNPATAWAALRAGELDFVASSLPPELVEPFRLGPGLAVVAADPMTAVEMRMNFEREPLSRPEFRRALVLAIDPDEVARRVAPKAARSGRMGYPHPDSPWTAPELGLQTDPASARALLDRMSFVDRDRDGWREDSTGKPLRLGLKVSSSEPLQLRAAEVLVSQLSSVGLACRMEVVDPAHHRGLFVSRRFDLVLSEISAHGLADPDQFAQSHRSGYLWRAGRPHPELQELLSRWRRAETAADRLAAGFALQRLHRSQPTTMPLYYQRGFLAYRPKRFAGWRAVPGLGVFHKWSFLPEQNL